MRKLVSLVVRDAASPLLTMRGVMRALCMACHIGLRLSRNEERGFCAKR